MPRPWLLILVLLMAAPTSADAPSAKGDADAIKVGFVYNFTRFIRWPPTDPIAARPAFVIAVVGDPAMLGQLAVLEQGDHRADGRPIRVEAVTDPAAIPACSMLFIGSDAAGQIDGILRQLTNRAVLTIGDTPGLARRGVVINFYRQRERVRFEINPGALDRAGLTAEAQLFDVAKIVEPGLGESRPVESGMLE